MKLIKNFSVFLALILGVILNTYSAARITQEVDQEETIEQENREDTQEEKKQMELLDAAKSGDLEKVKKLVAGGVNINCHNKSIDYEIADLRQYSSDDHVCLTEVIQCLSSDNNFTSLMLASKYGHIKVVEYLLTIPDIDINVQLDDREEEDETRFDAAHIAAFYKENEIFKLIISHPKYHPPRDILCSMIHVQKLLALGARWLVFRSIFNSIFINDKITNLILYHMQEAIRDIPSKEKHNVNYYTQLAIDNLKENINLPSPAESYTYYTEELPLLCTVANRCDELDCEVAQLLLKSKFINVNNKHVGMTPLGIISYRGFDNQEFNKCFNPEYIIKMVKLLTAHKDINLNALSRDDDDELFSPLVMAFKQRPMECGLYHNTFTDMIKHLLNFLNLSAKSVSLLYKLAIKNNDIEIQKLVEKFFERKKLKPLLFAAIKSGDEKAVRELIKKCPLKVFDDKTKDNPLHLAVEYGNANIIKLIFSNAPYLADWPNKDNLTPIDLAVTQPESLAIFFSDPIDLARCLKTTVTKENSLIKSSLISSASSSSTKTDVISALLKANLDYENSSNIEVSSSSKEDNGSNDSDGEKEIYQAQKKRRV